MTRTDYWNRFNSRQRAIEKKFIGSVYQAVRGQYVGFINAVRSKGYEYAKDHRYELVKADGIVKALKKMYRYAAYVEGNYVGSSLIKKYVQGKSWIEEMEYKSGTWEVKRVRSSDASFGIGLDEIADVVDQYFRIYQLNISGLPITRTTVKEIEDYLIRDVESGMPLDEALKNFRALALHSGDHPERVRSRQRARLIVQTEATRAMSFGGLIGAYKSGVDCDKEWVTCADERVRTSPYSHRTLDRVSTSLFGSFYNGEQIRFPGDPEASVANSINCRCTNFYKEKKRAQPRITGRSLSQFLIDFFTGFFAGTELAEAVIGTTTE